jgi:hypothetical protein
MPQKMTITVEITGANGEIVKQTRERELPDMEEFDKQGFRKSLDDIETAVLEARKEVSDEAVSEYLSSISKKKQNR